MKQILLFAAVFGSMALTVVAQGWRVVASNTDSFVYPLEKSQTAVLLLQ